MQEHPPNAFFLFQLQAWFKRDTRCKPASADNILIDDGGRCYLIDFDRGRYRRSNLKWKKENLLRLKRSLDKISKNEEVFYFSDIKWRSLLRGYGWDDLSQFQRKVLDAKI